MSPGGHAGLPRTAGSRRPLEIDGAHGEGGGQIVRSALTLATLLGRPVEIARVRAARPRPGLAAQHLTAVRALAALCGASLEGDALGSQHIRFAPAEPARAGEYAFDVAQARKGGSAGAASLVLQTVLLPLALTDGSSRVRIGGGTHMAWSPSYDYVAEVWLPTLRALGVTAEVELAAFGWYPVGGGKLRARIEGRCVPLAPLERQTRGELRRVVGRAIAAELPSHIPQRMAERARTLLAAQGIASRIEPLRVRARCPGAGLFLTAEYAEVRAGFSALGERGKAAELVAEEAVTSLLAHHASGAAIDPHLADQLVLPLALAHGTSRLSVAQVTSHLATGAWLVEQFGAARVRFTAAPDGTVQVEVEPTGVGPAARTA